MVYFTVHLYKEALLWWSRLGLCTSTTGNTSSLLAQETKIPHATVIWQKHFFCLKNKSKEHSIQMKLKDPTLKEKATRNRFLLSALRGI